MAFIAQIDEWVDESGHQVGKSIGLSAHLCILLPDKKVEPPAAAAELEQVCGKCGQPIRTWPFDTSAVPQIFDVLEQKIRDSGPTESAFWYLHCRCITVGYAAPIKLEEILAAWKSFRRVQHEALTKDRRREN